MKIYKQSQSKNGFTLLELLVVIAIIGILVAIGTVSYSAAQARARDSRRRQDIEAVSKALEQYYAAHSGSYPTQATCASSADEYLVGGTAPTDPKTGAAYTYACDDAAGTYCVCAAVEVVSSGNYETSTCTNAGGSKDYFCRQNQQ